MRKNGRFRKLAWLMILIQLFSSVAYADTSIQASTFSAVEYMGGYTVRFLNEAGEEIYQETDVPFETEISTIIERFVQEKPEYSDAIWGVASDYLVLNNVDVMLAGEAVAAAGGNTYISLQEAINAVEPDGTVLLLKDTEESINVQDKSFTLDMGGHTLSAAQTETRPFTQNGGNVTLQQGTITGGYIYNTKTVGGGIYISGGSFTGRYLEVKNNGVWGKGGGLYADGGAAVKLESCVISENYDSRYNTNGVGICVEDNTTLTARNTTISGNREGSGSFAGQGLAAYDSTVILEGCTVSDHSNTCKVCSGGGIFIRNTKLSATNTRITGNRLSGSSTDGGGICADNSTVTLNNCTITENTAGTGGGIYSMQSNVTSNGGIVRGNSASFDGGLSLGYSDLNLDGVEISQNSAVNGTGGIGFFGDGNVCKLGGCAITGNSGAVGGISVSGKLSENYDIDIRNCRITGNTGTADAGGLNENTSSICWIRLQNTVISGNTGYTAGGLYAGKIIYMPNGAVYGNISTDGNGGNDVSLASSSYVIIGPANAMSDGDYSFEDYCWIGGNGTETLTAGDQIYQWGAARACYYTAGAVYDVARNVTQDKVYTSLETAMQEVEEGDEIVLIAEDSDGNPTPVTANLTINSSLILDLNGHTLYGIQSVKEDGALTLKGEGKIAETTGSGYPLVIEGSITIEGGMSIEGIDYQSGSLEVTGAAEISVIKMREGMTVKAGNAFSPAALEFVLDDSVLARLNEGWRNNDEICVTLIVSIGGEALCDTLADGIAIQDANGMVTVEKDAETGNIVARSVMLNGVYADGASGDDNNDGLTPDSPVKTFERARTVLDTLLEALDDDARDAVDGIYVMGALQVTDSQQWFLPEGKALMRYPDYAGALVSVTGSLTLSDITLDGGAKQGFVANKAMVYVNGGALTIQDGANLLNNFHTQNSGQYYEGGGAVCCNNGSVTMTGGTISGNASWYGGGICVWSSIMSMSGGEISGNHVVEYNGYSPMGGGVSVMWNSRMTLDGGSISNNTGAVSGGGVSVGGIVVNYQTGSNFTMTSGSISGNSASKTGGGLYIEHENTATITGGRITGNQCAGSGAYGEFGGGGIYVNGGRGYETGRLYLSNVVISGNSAEIDGGGVASCGSSTINVYLLNGGAIFDNAGLSEVFLDGGGKIGGYRGNFSAVVSPYMLGGGACNWSTANVTVSSSQLAAMRGEWYLNNDPDSDAKASAEANAAVWITGNSSGTRGGGIGSNGFVQIGTAPTEGSWTPEATKTLTGRDMAEGEFSFIVTENGQQVSTGTNKAAAAGEAAEIAFEPIVYSDGQLGEKHTYVITEVQSGFASHVTGDATSFTVKVTVVEGPNGKLTAEVNEITVDGADKDDVAFTNQYIVKAVTANLTVNKLVAGNAPDAETFTFVLTAKAENPKGATLPQNTKADVQGTGSALFNEITFSRPGTYAFEIREAEGRNPSYDYDSSVWTATVTVKDDQGDALYVDSIQYTRNDSTETSSQYAEFTNNYTVPTAYAPTVVKVITGETQPADKTFSFTLTADNGNPDIGATLPSPATAACSGAGKARFDEIRFAKEGTYTFRISEIDGGDAGYTYEDTPWTLTVEIVRDQDSLEVASVTYQREKDGQTQTSEEYATFTNTYEVLPTDAALKVKKTVTGNMPGTEIFTFQIAAKDGNPAGGADLPANPQATITGSGEALFEAIRFKKAGTYRFEITEQNDGKPGYSYDGSVWIATVKVVDGGNQLRVESVSYEKQGEQPNAEAACFENSYATDETRYAPLVKKTITGATPPTAQVFSFSLSAHADNPEGAIMPEGAGCIVNVEGAESSNFGEITFTRDGTYKFEIRETEGSAAGYSYDDSLWTLTVEVKDVNGALTVESARYAKADGTQASAAEFVNEYAPHVAAAEILGEKHLEGASQTEETFAFRLSPGFDTNPMPDNSDASGATVTVQGSGAFSFGRIEYDEAGVYLYTVHEIIGDALGYTYDETLYEVTVTVTDAGGWLQTQVAYERNDGQVAEKAVFTNIYEVGSLLISKEVKGTGASQDKAFAFTVKLTDAAGNPISGVYSYAGLGGAASGTLENGAAAFELKHGQSIRIDGLPVGAQYVVEETEHKGYRVQADKPSGTITVECAEARFTNTREYHGEVPKTGYGESNTRYWIIGSCLLIALLAAVGRRKLNIRSKHG